MRSLSALFSLLLLLVSSSLLSKEEKPLHTMQIGFGGLYKAGIQDDELIAETKVKGGQADYTLLLDYEYAKFNRYAFDFLIDFRGYQDTSPSKTDAEEKTVLRRKAFFFYRLGASVGFPCRVKALSLTPYLGVEASSSKLNLRRSDAFPTSHAYFVRKMVQAKLGVKADKKISQLWGIGLKAELLYPLTDPELRTNILGSFVNNETASKTKKRWNALVEVPVSYYLEGGQSRIQVVPFVETQNVGHLNKDAFLGIPKETGQKLFSNYALGARVGYFYQF